MTTPETQQTISRSTILYGEEDAWYELDKFYTDHIQETCHRISTLHDEIWGKIILMEKNKRIAKAYLRIPEIVVDGSCNGFDGRRIGFCSFENPARDRSVEEIRTKIGAGVVLKMDQKGNVLAKRIGAAQVAVQGVERPELFCFGNEVIKLKGRLEDKQPVKVFDMNLFKNSIEQELQKPYPDRKRLMYHTLMRVSLVKHEQHPLKTPCWFAIINLVALDMLVNKVPTMPANFSDTIVFSPRSDDSMTDLQREQLMNQSSCDLYGTLTPLSQFTKNQIMNYPLHWSELTKSPSTELIDQLSRNQLQRPKTWKSPVGGYMSEAEGTKMMHRRGRSSEPRQIRPVSQCWSAVPSVENLSLYSTVDNHTTSTGRNFSAHTLKPTGSSGSKLISNANSVAYYGTLKNNAWMCVGSTSDYDSSRMDIYESSNSSSNSGISGSCRPSSPSIVSEASESQTSDSGFADTEVVSSSVISSSSTSSPKSGKDKIINGASLPNLRLPLIQRTLTPMSDLTVIDLKRESMEGKEFYNDQQLPRSQHNDQCNKLETKPTVVMSDQMQPIPPARKRHLSLQRNERKFLPLSLPATNVDSDDDSSDSTKVWSF